MTEPDWAALDAAWRPARTAGVLGGATTEALVAHAAGFLPAACRVDADFSGLDLGTGAGVPGVVLAALRPSSRWTLVDANQRRCALAQSAVRSLGLSQRVSVVHARAEELAHDAVHRFAHDLVVARSFGPPEDLAECGLPFVRPGGRMVVSVTEETLARWQAAVPAIGVRVAEQAGEDGSRYASVFPPPDVPASWPRRRPARRRRPLF